MRLVQSLLIIQICLKNGGANKTPMVLTLSFHRFNFGETKYKTSGVVFNTF